MRKWLVILAFILGACKQPKQPEQSLTYKKLVADDVATNLSFIIGDLSGRILSAGESESITIPWYEGQPIKKYRAFQISAISDGTLDFVVTWNGTNVFKDYGPYACSARCMFAVDGRAYSKDTFTVQLVSAQSAHFISVSVGLREVKNDDLIKER